MIDGYKWSLVGGILKAEHMEKDEDGKLSILDGRSSPIAMGQTTVALYGSILLMDRH